MLVSVPQSHPLSSAPTASCKLVNRTDPIYSAPETGSVGSRRQTHLSTSRRGARSYVQRRQRPDGSSIWRLQHSIPPTAKRCIMFLGDSVARARWRTTIFRRRTVRTSPSPSLLIFLRPYIVGRCLKPPTSMPHRLDDRRRFLAIPGEVGRLQQSPTM